MPNRLLKEGIVDSDPLNGLSAEAEVCFYRLLVVSDDLGRMDARTVIVRARCFPLKEQSNLVAKIEIWLGELVKSGVILRYVADGQPYLQIQKWDQRVRSKGKYPPPPDNIPPTTGGQLTADGGQPSADGGLGLGMGMGMGMGMGKGKGASKQNEVLFEAATGEWSVPDILETRWAKAYPAVDIHAQMSAASAWLIANPKNQKSNYARFLTGWLTRAQDKAARVGGVRAPEPEQRSFV